MPQVSHGFLSCKLLLRNDCSGTDQADVCVVVQLFCRADSEYLLLCAAALPPQGAMPPATWIF